MRVLITGADGGIGSRLLQELTGRGHETHGVDVNTLDVTAYPAVIEALNSLQPDLVVHCAALTDVDRCAREPELAMRINAIGTQNVALACQRVGAALCFLSTNEVFDGQKGTAYREYDPANPINPYGYSKWVAEQMVREVLPQHFVVRTSWIFAHGGRNFMQKIIERAASGQPLSVVTNEIACPTYAEDFVQALLLLLETGRFGTYHLVNEGYASRYDFARVILDSFGYSGVEIRRVIGAQYPRPSRPPVYSALENQIAAYLGIKLRPWPDAVQAFVEHERAIQPG